MSRRRVGRPSLGRRKSLTVRVPLALYADLMEQGGTSNTNLVEVLRRGLAQKPQRELVQEPQPVERPAETGVPARLADNVSEQRTVRVLRTLEACQRRLPSLNRPGPSIRKLVAEELGMTPNMITADLALAARHGLHLRCVRCGQALQGLVAAGNGGTCLRCRADQKPDYRQPGDTSTARTEHPSPPAVPGRRTVVHSISWPPTLLGAVRRLAEEKGTNLSEEVRAAVARHLGERGSEAIDPRVTASQRQREWWTENSDRMTEKMRAKAAERLRKRNEAIVRMKDEGLSDEEIGTAHRLTVAKVQEIIDSEQEIVQPWLPEPPRRASRLMRLSRRMRLLSQRYGRDAEEGNEKA